MSRKLHKRHKRSRFGLAKSMSRSDKLARAVKAIREAKLYIATTREAISQKACPAAINNLTEVFQRARDAEVFSEAAGRYVQGVGKISDEADRLMEAFKKTCLVKGLKS